MSIKLRVGIFSLGLLLLLSCEEKFEVYRFPKVIDTVQFHLSRFDTDPTNQSWISHAYFGFLYIGPSVDTIIAGDFLKYEYKQDTIDTRSNYSLHSLNKYTDEWMEGNNHPSAEQAEIKLYIDTSTLLNGAYPTILHNNTNDTLNIGHRENIPLIMEAQDSSGTWKPIQEVFRFMCGVGANNQILPPNQIVLTLTPIFQGSFRTQLRLRLGQNTSSPFSGSINYRQFQSRYNDE